MAALGAELTLVRSEGGLTTRKLVLDMIEAARELSEEPHTYWIDQLKNRDSIAGYYPLGEEVWSQTKGEVAGANVVAAIRVAKRLGPGAKVVTLMVDSGLKYLSTEMYRGG